HPANPEQSTQQPAAWARSSPSCRRRLGQQPRADALPRAWPRSRPGPGRRPTPPRRQEKPLMDFAGKVGLIVGVANHRSLSWAIAQATASRGASLILTYQGRFEEHVGDLAATLTPRPMVL